MEIRDRVVVRQGVFLSLPFSLSLSFLRLSMCVRVRQEEREKV